MTNRRVSPGEHLITTAPSLTICRKVVEKRTGRMCKRPVLAATVGGLDRKVGTETLNDTGELAALLAGRRSYALVAQDYLAPRTVHSILAGPARRPVLADHDCAPIPDHHIEHAWSLAAQALCSATLGATVIETSGDSQPPF